MVAVVLGRVWIEAAATPISSVIRALIVTVPPDPTVVGEIVGGKIVGGVMSVPPMTVKLPPASRGLFGPNWLKPLDPASTFMNCNVHLPDAAAGGTETNPFQTPSWSVPEASDSAI